nr:hypothetical protein [Micromonospora purpureochromogenes]
MIRMNPAATPTTPTTMSQWTYGLVWTSRSRCGDRSMAVLSRAPAPRA